MRLIMLLLIVTFLLSFAFFGTWRIVRWYNHIKWRLLRRYPWLQGRKNEDNEDDDDDDEDEDDLSQTVTYVYRSKEQNKDH